MRDFGQAVHEFARPDRPVERVNRPVFKRLEGATQPAVPEIMAQG